MSKKTQRISARTSRRDSHRAVLSVSQPDNGPERARGMARGLTLLTMRRGREFRLGVKTIKGILDVINAAALFNMYVPGTMDDLLQNEDGPSLNALVDKAMHTSESNLVFIEERFISYGPVVTRPGKILCVGLNYRRHASEVHLPIPQHPVLFSKFNNSLSGHNQSVKLPLGLAQKFDYEAELVIVMGRKAQHVSEQDALSCVAGYCVGNDLSARDLQFDRGGQWLIGKTLDDFAPLGPYLVTAEQLNPDQLKIECQVNGEVRQRSSTDDFIFSCAQVVSYISQHITLQPGDIIFTGTPEGVILGHPPEKQVWLKPGDQIACSIESLGELKFELV